MSRYALTSSRRRTVSDAYGTLISGRSGLIGYWRGDGSTVDAVSGGTAGTLTNGATYGAALLAARPSASSFSLDGVDDYVNIPSQAKFALTSAISAECWVNFDTLASSGVREIFVRQNAWGIEQSAGLLRFFIYRSAASVGLLTSATLTAGTTYHVVGTFDGTATRLYINGSQVATTTTAGAIDSNTNPVQIGAWGAGFYFDGRVAEAALYNRALSASEVSTAYTTGSTP